MPRSRKLIFYCSPLAIALALTAWGGFQVQRLESGATELATSGTAAIKLLKEAAAGLQDNDLDRLMAVYAADYSNPYQAPWSEQLRSDRDGIRVYDWLRGEPRDYDRDAMAAELESQLLNRIGDLEMAKFKLAAVEEILGEDEMHIRAILWLRGTRPLVELNGGGTAELANTAQRQVFETQASFRMRLRREPAGWKIANQDLIQGETVVGPGRGFTDIAKAAGIDYVA